MKSVDICDINIFLGVFSFGGTHSLSLQKRFPVLVKPRLRNDNLAWVNADQNTFAVCLVASNSLNVDDPFSPVDGYNLSLTIMIVASDDHDLVILANWKTPNVELLTKLL